MIFFLNYIQLLYYKCYKINRKRAGSDIDSPDWMKKQKNNNKSHK